MFADVRNLGWILKDKIFVACLFTNKQKLLNVGSGNNSLPQKLMVVMTKTPCYCSLYSEDYTTQLYRYHNKPS